MGDRKPSRATLRDKFELEKFRSKVVKSEPEMEPSPSNFNQKQKSTDMEDIVKHMKHVPSYLERGKPFQDRALSFGVMDWTRLEKWQNRHCEQSFVKNIKCSPSSSYSSLFTADGSSPRSSRDRSCSPARHKANRVTLQSHFKASPKVDSTADIKSCSESAQSSQRELFPLRNQSSPRTNKTPERRSIKNSSKNSGLKSRSLSPLRRFSFSLKSATEKADSPVSQNSNKDSNRSHSSPIRRLLDPIFPSKEACHEDSRKSVDGGISSSSSWKQALFRTTVKNERLLFTFAVENKKEILAATVKDNNKDLLYTFFTVLEAKKKSISWLSQGNRSKEHGYVPNVTAQMKVSNSHCDTREFVLFSVNPNIQPQEELEAVVVKFSKNNISEDNQESFSTTVILPGGSHGVPSKGEPSPLVDRWRSGGVCDCGGWDVGCRLRTLSNQVHSSDSRTDKTHMTAHQFELYFQGEFQDNRPIFSLSPLKEGIFSIDYNASLSPLQAFSICISYLESRKMTRNTQPKTHIPQPVPRVYTPIPRIKRSVTGKVTSL